MNFVVDGKHIGVKVPGKVGVNDAEAYLLCGLNGAGLIQLPRFMMYEHLRTGELIEVLHDWVPPPKLVSAVYPYNRHLSAKVRVFIDWIAEIFSSCPMLASGESADCKAVEVPAIRFPRSTPVVVDHAEATEVPLALS
jgi:LysR family transcriptional regulator for bpeEF and oprC